MSSKEPKIPAVKLAEYVVAKTSAQRTAIIRSCIETPQYLFRYGQVQEAIGRSLIARDERPLQKLILLLEKQLPKNEQHAKRIVDAVKCAKAAEYLLDYPLIASLQIAKTSSFRKQFVLEGVRVIVAPQCLIMREHPKGLSIGGLKCYTSKTIPLGEPVANHIGVLLHWYLEAFYPGKVIDPAICVVADIFQQQIYHAPKSFVQRRQRLMHACQEIYDRWQSIAARLREEPTGERPISTSPN